MKGLSDVVGASGLGVYAEIALVIFFVVFVAIALRVFFMKNTDLARVSRLPLDDEPVVIPSEARDLQVQTSRSARRDTLNDPAI